MQPPKFTPDARLQQVVEKHAALAIGFVKKKFDADLDWTEASMAHVERMLDEMEVETKKSPWPPQRIESVATAFGCYIGETIRRNYGGVWGTIDSGGGKSWGLMIKNGVLMYPCEKAFKRLNAGASEDICHYYRATKTVIATTP